MEGLVSATLNVLPPPGRQPKAVIKEAVKPGALRGLGTEMLLDQRAEKGPQRDLGSEGSPLLSCQEASLQVTWEP